MDELPVRSGFKISYRIRLSGLPVRWLTTITEYDPPNGFVDEQTKGPYRYWRHEHTFEDTGDGGTIMRDRVRYELPLGILGAVAHRIVVARQLRRIFDYRNRRIRRLFPPAEVPAPSRDITSPEAPHDG